MKVMRIILMIVFGWSLFKTLELLVRRGSVDRLLFEGAGLSWLFWCFLLPLAALQACALLYLWQPSPARYRLAQIAVLVGLVESVSASLIGYSNPELLKHAITASRTERGLPVRDDLLRLVDNPMSHLFPLLIAIVFGCVWLVLLFKIRQAERSSAAREA